MPQSDTITIRAVGDMLFPHREPEWDSQQFAELGQLIENADFAFANLENPLVDHGLPIPKVDIARADVARIALMQRLGLNAVSIGNNHIMDFGVEGLESTTRALNKAKIDFAGAGHTRDSAFAATHLTVKDLKVALISVVNCFSLRLEHYADVFEASRHQAGAAVIQGHQVRLPTGGTATAPSEVTLQLLEDSIRRARRKADVVIVSMHTHWGADTAQVDPGRQVITRAAIEAGADLIIGHGPHAINGIEVYKDRFIVHSMGNFFFHIPEGIAETSPDSCPFVAPMIADERFWLGIMVEAQFGKKSAPDRLTLYPVQIARDEELRGLPYRADETAARHVFRILEPQCAALGTKVVAQADGSILVTLA